jgi:hypothetical protein
LINSSNHRGLSGHLATITSAQEQSFVEQLLDGVSLPPIGDFPQIWIGGSDAAEEGKWNWVAGPEMGTPFWQCGPDGMPLDGAYSNWATLNGIGRQPDDNDIDGEDFLSIEFNPIPGEFPSDEMYQWNDSDASRTGVGYVVEYSPEVGPESVCAAFTLLADRDVEVYRPLAFEGDIHANDDIDLYVAGPSTYTANLSAVDDIEVRRDNTIEGDATAGDRIRISGSSAITGAVTEQAAVDAISLPQLNFGAGGSDVTVSAGRALALVPGSYGDVEVKRHGTLFLYPGDYFMKSLETRLLSRLSIDAAEGPVMIHITDKLELGPSSKVVITPYGEAGSRAVTFLIRQERPVKIRRGARVLRTLIAPEAKVEVLSQFQLRGASVPKT